MKYPAAAASDTVRLIAATLAPAGRLARSRAGMSTLVPAGTGPVLRVSSTLIGVICTNGSDMLFLQDTDGDDKADVRKVLFTGFSMGDTHAGVSNLRYGHDGWIYATVGYSGYRGYVGGKQQQFTQGMFRFKPDASELEYLQPTTNNTWGLGTTSDFDVMGCTANGNPSFYPTHAQAAYESIGRRAPR